MSRVALMRGLWVIAGVLAFAAVLVLIATSLYALVLFSLIREGVR